MTDSEMKKIIGGENYDSFCRKADNNMHRTSKGKPSSGEYFFVQIQLENFQSINIVPNFVDFLAGLQSMVTIFL